MTQYLALISKWKVLWRFSEFPMNGVCLWLCKQYFLPPDGKKFTWIQTPKKKLKDGSGGERKTFDKKQMRIYG